MCNFLSGVVTIERYPKVLCADLLFHEKTISLLDLKAKTYREWEWTRDDDGKSLKVRVVNGENPNDLKSAILAKFPNRAKCLAYCIKQVLKQKKVRITRDCTGLTKLDAPNAEYVYANGCIGLTKKQ
jgi:hypothetical protein